MKKILFNSITSLLFFTLLTGILYPLGITLIGQLFFPAKANGSLIVKNNKVIGSKLIGQNFVDSTYFYSRPSAINYNPMPSGASNLGLSSALLHKQVTDRRNEFKQKNVLQNSTAIPPDMVFASGSGVDPHISVESARLQVNRIINSRKLDSNKTKSINNLIDSLTEYPQFGVLGNKVVNVLELNLQLDEESKKWKTQN